MDNNLFFKRATINDLDKIINFLKTNFKKRKSYYEKKDFFKNEFLDFDEYNMNCVISCDKSDNILSLSSYYMPNKHFMLSGLWSSNEKSPPMTGFLTRKYMIDTVKPNIFCGITEIKESLISHRRFAPNILNFEYYIVDKYKYKYNSNNLKLINLTSDIYFLDEKSYSNIKVNFYKTYSYFFKRYISNLFLDYKIYALYDADTLLCIIVFKINYEKKILCIVDYLGNYQYINNIDMSVLADEYDCNFIDFLCYGFDSKILLDSGFILKKDIDYSYTYNGKSPTNYGRLYAFSTKTDIFLTRGDGILQEI